MLVIGSSLLVAPVSQLPRVVLDNGGTLAILTESETPYDDVAQVRLHGRAGDADAGGPGRARRDGRRAADQVGYSIRPAAGVAADLRRGLGRRALLVRPGRRLEGRGRAPGTGCESAEIALDRRYEAG